MKLWIDDCRPAPEEYIWIKSVNDAKDFIRFFENPTIWPSYIPSQHTKQAQPVEIELIDVDHDAGDFAHDGGDYIKLLDWLEATGYNYPIHIHSQNPVGVQNMRRIIERNGWKEIK